MRIKEICEKSGLTDRTVRYYIEEKLLDPYYTENYLGRKSFDFSEDDLARLKDIATLRAFGFSVEEIRELLLNRNNFSRIINDVKTRTKDSLDQSTQRLDALMDVDATDLCSVSELAEKLLAKQDLEAQGEKIKTNVARSIFSALKFIGVFLVVWLPILLTLTVLAVRIIGIRYFTVNPLYLSLCILAILPSLFAVAFLGRIKNKKLIKWHVIPAVCALCIPFCIIFSVASITECDHSWSDYSVSVFATCSFEGEKIVRCEDCHKFETRIVDCLPHTEKTVEGKNATCTEDGFEDGAVCSVCGEILKDQKKLDATGHSYQRYEIQQSCGVDGCVLFKCHCSAEYKENVIPATGKHDFVINSNQMGYTCKGCGLEVCEAANVDGSIAGGNNQVKYYITGSAVAMNIPRTLVIYGEGDMPDFGGKELGMPLWSGSLYIKDVTTVTIEKGITSIGNYAFTAPKNDNCYASVKKFIIKSPSIKINEGDSKISGIKCKITFEY